MPGHNLLTNSGQEATVRAPNPGEVLMGNTACAWAPMSLEEHLAPFQAQLDDLFARVEALEQLLTQPKK